MSSCILSTLGHCATMSFIHIWNMSWLIFSPNGMHRKWYLPRCVLNIVSNDTSLVRCILKNALLLSTFENCVAPVSTWAISSSVGALWFSLIMTLLRSFGSRHILSLPFGFFGYISKLTHGVSSILFHYDSLADHLVQFVFDFCLVLNWYFASPMLYRWYLRINFDVILTWHVANSVKTFGIQGLQVCGTINLCTTWFHIDWVEPGCSLWNHCWLFLWLVP